MNVTDQLETLRKYWHAEGCTKEEKDSISITAAALKEDEPTHREFVQKRIQKHQLRYETIDYTR